MTKETTATTLARMEGKIDGINEHLVRLNGSVAKHASWIEDQDKTLATRWGKQDVINVILGAVGIACIGGLVAIFITKTYGG